MNELFRVVSERLKMMFTAHAALELQAELLIRHVERKALLLQRANQLEHEGMTDLAEELRQHVKAMDLNRPADGAVALPAPALSGGTAETLPSPANHDAEGASNAGRRKKT